MRRSSIRTSRPRRSRSCARRSRRSFRRARDGSMTEAASTAPAKRRVPVFDWLFAYDRGWLRGDLVAGLTVWAVLVPEALAYASIAGVSPVVGLYAAPPALIFYAAFGSSRHLVTGPMSATAALSAAAVADITTDS